MKKKLNIQYFAKLREESGISSEIRESEAENAQELFTELSKTHNFSWDHTHFRLAINEEFQEWEYPLKDGDTVVFIQPVAGG